MLGLLNLDSLQVLSTWHSVGMAGGVGVQLGTGCTCHGRLKSDMVNNNLYTLQAVGLQIGW